MILGKDSDERMDVNHYNESKFEKEMDMKSAGSASRSSAGEDGVGDAGAEIVTAAAGAGCGRMQWTRDGGVKCGKSSV
ncbi:hypothetical protein TNCV_4210281 [Trichonephila clavipes]|nr:hypothetical protein TNCV_4210281 [Trichonephila clavipes]